MIFVTECIYMHIENFINHYKCVPQFEILNIPKKEPQTPQKRYIWLTVMEF